MSRGENATAWNFSVNLWDITFITLGFSLISRETVIPVLVSQLTDSKLAIGLIPAMVSLGLYLPQLLTANMAERMVYKKPFVMLVGILWERSPYLLIGLVVFLFALPHPTVALVAVLGGVGLATMGAGVATPAWLDMIAKVIPVNKRGIWLGLGHGLGQLMGVLGAFLVSRILVGFAFPGNYSLLFILAFVFMIVSWGGLALTREPPSQRTKETVPLNEYLGRLPGVLAKDHNYRRYLISKTLVNAGAMSAGFFAVYGTELYALDGRGVGLLTGVLVGTQAVLNPLWGLLADRFGHKSVLASAAIFLVLAPLCALLLDGGGGAHAVGAGLEAGASGPAPGLSSILGGVPPSLVLTFVFLAAYLSADHTSSLNIILEFCDPEDRPTYVGLTNTLLAPVLICAPIFGGWLAGTLGYGALFGTALAVSAAAAVSMLFWVREPRRELVGSPV